MAGIFPTNPGFRSVKTRVRHYNLSSESITGRIQVRSLGASRREFTLEYPPMTKAEFEPVYDFFMLQNGMLETFTVTIPDPTNPSLNQNVLVRLAGDIQEFDIGFDSLYSFEVDLVEELL